MNFFREKSNQPDPHALQQSTCAAKYNPLNTAPMGHAEVFSLAKVFSPHALQQSTSAAKYNPLNTAPMGHAEVFALVKRDLMRLK